MTEEDVRVKYREVADKFNKFLDTWKTPKGKVTKSALEQVQQDYDKAYEDWTQLRFEDNYETPALDRQTRNAFETAPSDAYERLKEYENAEIDIGGRRRRKTRKRTTRRKKTSRR
jgi:hypothetical protein